MCERDFFETLFVLWGYIMGPSGKQRDMRETREREERRNENREWKRRKIEG